MSFDQLSSRRENATKRKSFSQRPTFASVGSNCESVLRPPLCCQESKGLLQHSAFLDRHGGLDGKSRLAACVELAHQQLEFTFMRDRPRMTPSRSPSCACVGGRNVVSSHSVSSTKSTETHAGQNEIFILCTRQQTARETLTRRIWSRGGTRRCPIRHHRLETIDNRPRRCRRFELCASGRARRICCSARYSRDVRRVRVGGVVDVSGLDAF